MAENNLRDFSEPVGPLNPILLPNQANQIGGRIIRWFKHEGEAINKGEPLVEVETRAGTFTITASQRGTLWRISRDEGTVVPDGALLGLELPDELPSQASAASGRLLLFYFIWFVVAIFAIAIVLLKVL